MSGTEALVWEWKEEFSFDPFFIKRNQFSTGMPRDLSIKICKADFCPVTKQKLKESGSEKSESKSKVWTSSFYDKVFNSHEEEYHLPVRSLKRR
jgi:hypothetical protein